MSPRITPESLPRAALGPDLLRADFPRPVGAAIRRGDAASEGDLYPVEAAALSPRAVAKRRRDFILGRSAAHAALADLGHAPTAIPRLECGGPGWPPDVVGAITHSGKVAAAVVASASAYAGIGIDIEMRASSLSAAAARRVCLPAECAWADDPAGQPALRYLLAFSAKESIFKALFPVESVWLGFDDAELRWDPERSGFLATLRRDAGARFHAGMALPVRCHVLADAVLTTTYLPAASG